MEQVLFICTGNYYRSRFAEAVFNHEAVKRGLPWRAFSRGLAIHLVDGPLSPYTEAALAERRIDRAHTGPDRQQVADADLERAARAIALKTAEHQPLMRQLHPAWAERITYWNFHDIDFATPEEVLPRIEEEVLALLAELEGKKKGNGT